MIERAFAAIEADEQSSSVAAGLRAAWTGQEFDQQVLLEHLDSVEFTEETLP